MTSLQMQLTKQEAKLTMRAAMPRLYLDDYRIGEVEKADPGWLAELFRHHWDVGVAEDLDGLYRRLERQEEAAKRGEGWEQAQSLRAELKAFGDRLIPSLYALRRLSESYDLYDDVLALVVQVEAQTNVALMLIDAIGKAVPARRRRSLSLRWFIQPIIERIDEVLSTGIAALCERAGVEVPKGSRTYQ